MATEKRIQISPENNKTTLEETDLTIIKKRVVGCRLSPDSSQDDDENSILDFVESCYNSPLSYVLGAFDWVDGQSPDSWQVEVMQDIEKSLTSGDNLQASIRIAVTSGHGVGKTALTAWIILWAMTTRPHLRGVITANTQTQLRDKTWAELALWHKAAINAHWFKMTATKIYQKQNTDTWFCSAVPWSKECPEAFAGLHAQHVLLIFDEASAIDPIIYETAEGAMTTNGAIWLCFGNPTRNSGRFFEIHHKYRHRWICKQIDSRSVKMTNKNELSAWIEDYGEDSDFVRVRIKGEFPRSGSNQLISFDIIDKAALRNVDQDSVTHAPKIMGVDVARFGDDQSVICKRQGLFTHEMKKYRKIDTMTLSGIIATEIDQFDPDAVFIDEGGVGGGVIDRLRQLGYLKVFGVEFGSSSSDKARYANKRSEMWAMMAEWLKIGAIPKDRQLIDDLTAPEYFYRGDNGAIQLERKDDMKRRGLSSPDCGDALALTFAYPVYKNKSEFAKVKLRR